MHHSDTCECLRLRLSVSECAGEPHARFDEEARVTICYSGFTLLGACDNENDDAVCIYIGINLLQGTPKTQTNFTTIAILYAFPPTCSNY